MPLEDVPRPPSRPGRTPLSTKRCTIPGVLLGSLRKLETLALELCAKIPDTPSLQVIVFLFVLYGICLHGYCSQFVCSRMGL
jgi:hypothetical protein